MMTREQFGELLAERGLSGPAVEVGVYYGDYAEIILSWGVEKLYLVDLWAHVPDGKAELAQSDEEFQEILESCLERLTDDLERVVVLRGFSVEMASRIPDDSCDFIFIDASHDGVSVDADLRAYWPKLRSGGILAGHDYHIAGVQTSVNRLASEYGMEVHQAPVNEGDISFWCEKP